LTICNTDGSCFSIASLWQLPPFSAFSARRSLWTFHCFCLALSIETWPSFLVSARERQRDIGKMRGRHQSTFSSALHFSLVFLMQRKSFLGPKTSLEFFTVCCHILIAQVSVYTTAFGHIQCVALQILAIYGCTDIQYKYFLSGFMAM